MSKIKSLSIVIFLILISCIILFKCNNPVRTWIQHLRVKHAANKSTHQDQQQVIKLLHPDSTTYYRDAYNREHAVAQDATIKLGIANAVYPRKMDSIAKNYGLKVKQLQRTIDMMATVHSQQTYSITPVRRINPINPEEIAPISWYTFNIDDSFLTGYGRIDSTLSNVLLDYSANISVHYGLGWTRPCKILFIKFKNFPLAKQKFTINAYSDNNKIHITQLSTIKIEK